MKGNNVIFNLIGAITCFILFVIGMLFSEQIALLILIGIIGLSGFSYFTFRVVLIMLKSKTTD